MKDNILKNKGDYSWKIFFKDYWVFLKGRRLVFSFFTFLRGLSNIIPFINTFFLGLIVDFFTHYQKGDPLTLFFLLAGGISVLGMLQVYLRFYSKDKMQTIAAHIRKDLRIKAMSNMMDYSLAWHEKEETGSKIQKINAGADSVFQGVKDFSNEGMRIITELGGALLIFFGLNWKYAVFSLIYLAIYLGGERYYNKKVAYWEDQVNKIKEKVSGKIHESASNLLTVKTLGLQKSFERSTSINEKKYFEMWKKRKAMNYRKTKTIKAISALSQGLFILLVGFEFIKGNITLGSILIFVNYYSKLVSASQEITHKMPDFISVKSQVGRFMSLFGAEILSDEGEFIMSKKWKKIFFNDVCFKYKDEPTLNHFNLSLNKNEKVGIVGRSGCGKSTLVKLLLNLY
ncbi:MAG: ABC transporter ATP-binding protein, partial [Candidatus Woesearchaeota archaeon]